MCRPGWLSRASNGRQKEDYKLLQCSQLRHQGECWHVSVSARWQSWHCSQDFDGHFLWAVLPTKVKAGCLSNGGRREDKSAHNSTTKVSFDQHQNYTFVSMHGRDHNGVAKISVGHSEVVKNNLSRLDLDYAAQYFLYQECNIYHL